MIEPNKLGAFLLIAQILAGAIGVIITFGLIFRPVTTYAVIDHPSTPWRWFYRCAAYAHYNLYSVLVSPAVWMWVLPASGSEQVKNSYVLQVVFAFGYPIPLAVIFYLLHVKISRWWKEFSNQRKMTIGEIALQKAKEQEPR